MARLTGEWREGTGKKVWKNFRLSIDKYSKFAAKEIIDRARYDLHRWESDVYEVLSDPLAESQWHKRRDPSRMFPHLNTGKQVSGISAGVNYKFTGAGNYAITSWAEVDSPYAEYTNMGYRMRGDGQTPNWIGWLDDVFYGTRGFFSVADVFERLMADRLGVR